MTYPKVYLQIPHYNNAEYLQACIESCQKLEYNNLDILFFNDASEDDTKKALGQISTEGISIYHNSQRLGRVGNYQNCFSHHKDAQWFANLDSDDYYTDFDWIKVAMDIVVENPSDKIVHIQSNFLEGIPVSDLEPMKDYDNGYQLIKGSDYIKLCIKYYNFSHLGSIFNTELVKKYGAYIDDCMHTDFLTAARVAAQGNVLIGNRKIGQWRKHDGNQSDTRYSKEEYKKNGLAYYKFFEWAESHLSYSQCKQLVQAFEKREFDKKLVSHIQEKRIIKTLQLIQNEKDGLVKFRHSLISIIFTSQVESLEKLKNVGIGIATRVLSVLITLLTVPFIIHYVGIENYGWIGVYTTIASAMYILDFGLTNLITKEIAQHIDKSNQKIKEIIGSQEFMYHLIGISILCVLLSGSSWIATHWITNESFSLDNRISIIRLISLAIFFQWPHSFYSGVLFGLGEQITSNITQLFFTLLKNLGIVLVFQFLGADIYDFFIWQIIISVCTILAQKYYIKRVVNAWNTIAFASKAYIQHISDIAISFSLITVFGFIYSDLNNFLLSKWLSLKQFGYYNILFNVIITMIMYCATVKNALFPYISQIVQANNPKKEKKDFLKYSKLVNYTLIPCSIFLSIFSYETLILWFNDTAIAMAVSSSLSWIALGSLSNALMIIPWTFLIAKAKTRFLIYLTGSLALVSIPILCILVGKYGLKGASMYWFVINFFPMIGIQLYYDKLYHDIIWIKWIDLFIKPIFYTILIFTSIKISISQIDLPLKVETMLTFGSLLTFYVYIAYTKVIRTRNKI